LLRCHGRLLQRPADCVASRSAGRFPCSTSAAAFPKVAPGFLGQGAACAFAKNSRLIVPKKTEVAGTKRTVSHGSWPFYSSKMFGSPPHAWGGRRTCHGRSGI